MATGHVMRCLALGQAWQDAGGNVVFAMAESTPAVDARLRCEGMEIVQLDVSPNSVQDVRKVKALAGDRRAAWVVVDGYQFDSEYQRSLKNAGLKLLFVDDLGQCERYFADIVLNQSVHASEEMYANHEIYTRLLLGPRFAMLRRDFQPWTKWRREITPNGHKVLVTMGGSDPDNVTAIVLEALRALEIDELEVVAVLGGSNPHVDSLERFASQSPSIRFLRDAPNMPELMAWADIAVSVRGFDMRRDGLARTARDFDRLGREPDAGCAGTRPKTGCDSSWFEQGCDSCTDRRASAITSFVGRTSDLSVRALQSIGGRRRRRKGQCGNSRLRPAFATRAGKRLPAVVGVGERSRGASRVICDRTDFLAAAFGMVQLQTARSQRCPVLGG